MSKSTHPLNLISILSNRYICMPKHVCRTSGRLYAGRHVGIHIGSLHKHMGTYLRSTYSRGGLAIDRLCSYTHSTLHTNHIHAIATHINTTHRYWFGIHMSADSAYMLIPCLCLSALLAYRSGRSLSIIYW